MIIACPSCSTQFNLADHLYSAGRKARCSQCQHVFVLPEPVLRPLQKEAQHEQTNPQPTQPSSAPAQPDIFTSFADSAASAKKRPAFKRKPLLLGLGFLFVIALGVLCFFLFFKGGESAPDTDAAGKAQSKTEDGVSKLNVIVGKNFFVENEKLGKIFVVEGKVQNNFTAPKAYIAVEITLYDQAGKILHQHRQYCGAMLSLFQLQIMGKDELNTAISNKWEILSNNSNVRPGSEVPFLLVVLDPPADLYTFTVLPVEARDPDAEQ